MQQEIRKVTVLASIAEPIARLGLLAILEPDPEFELVGLPESDPELIASARECQPDVILYRLNSEFNLGVIQELRRNAPRSAIVLWGHELSAEMALQAMDVRVRGLLNATCTVDTLKECLKVTASDRVWMEQSLSTALLRARPIVLSKRQSQILGLLVQGLKNKEIAAQLGISEGTVKSYFTKLFEKVGAKDRFELALFGLKNLGRLTDSKSAGASHPRPRLRSMLAYTGSRRTVA